MQLVQQPQRRGAEMFAYDLTSELRRRGHEVLTVYLYPADGADPLPIHGPDVALGANPRHPFEKIPGVHPAVVWKLRDLVKSFRPDIVQANGARTLKYGAALRRSCRSHPFGFVYRSIGDPLVWVRGRSKRTIFRAALMPAVDGIAAVSTASLAGLRELYRLDGKIVTQIPRGIDPARVAPTASRPDVRESLNTSPECPVVVYVGSLAPEKRPDRLARVFARVVAGVDGARLYVVGDGPERQAFEALLSGLSITDRVSMLGVSDEVGSYIAAADVLLLTSDTEGLPGVVLEAASLGIPSVATRVGGVGDAVVAGENGLLADPEDEVQLAEHVIALLKDDTRRLALGTAALERFESTYAISAVTDRYVSLYDDVHRAEVP